MRAWIVSLRLRTLPLAISVIAMGSVLAYRSGSFNWNIFLLACLTTIMLQILSNLANEYGDFKKGADNVNRSGPIRSIQSGHLSKKAMLYAMILFGVLSLFSGLLLLYLASSSVSMFVIFLSLGIIAIMAAVYYTVGHGAYGYRGLGDVSVFVFFGLLGVLGSFYLYHKSLPAEVFLPAISMGFFSTAVLNINNIRDIENDEKSGKITIPVRLGSLLAVKYHWALLALGLFASIIYSWITYSHPIQLLYLVITPLLVKNAISVKKFAGEAKLDPYLKQMVITTLIYTATFVLGILLS